MPLSTDQDSKDRELIARADRGEELGAFELRLLERARAREQLRNAARGRRTAADARAHALRLAELLRELGGPRVNVWSREGVGTRLYFPGEAGFLAIGMDGTIRDRERGKLVFMESALYPEQRKKVRLAIARLLLARAGELG
jgi:hypothetical protein